MPIRYNRPPGYRPSYQNKQIKKFAAPNRALLNKRASKLLKEHLMTANPNSVRQFNQMLRDLDTASKTWDVNPFAPGELSLNTIQNRPCSHYSRSGCIIGTLLVLAGLLQSANAGAVQFEGGAVSKYEFHPYPGASDRLVMTIYTDRNEIRELNRRVNPAGRDVCSILGNPQRHHPSHDLFHSDVADFDNTHVHLTVAPDGARCLHDKFKAVNSNGRVFTNSSAATDREVDKEVREIESQLQSASVSEEGEPEPATPSLLESFRNFFGV